MSANHVRPKRVGRFGVQAIETGVTGIMGALWSGARGAAAAAAREAREVAAALELDAALHRTGSLLDRGIEVRRARARARSPKGACDAPGAFLQSAGQ
jgi:hypothetical protein